MQIKLTKTQKDDLAHALTMFTVHGFRPEGPEGHAPYSNFKIKKHHNKAVYNWDLNQRHDFDDEVIKTVYSIELAVKRDDSEDPTLLISEKEIKSPEARGHLFEIISTIISPDQRGWDVEQQVKHLPGVDRNLMLIYGWKSPKQGREFRIYPGPAGKKKGDAWWYMKSFPIGQDCPLNLPDLGKPGPRMYESDSD